MTRRIIWSGMVWPAFLSIFIWQLLLDSPGETDILLSSVAGLWAGTLLVCGAFWRFGWRISAARQLCLWGFIVSVGTVVLCGLLFAIVIAGVLPITPIRDWLIAQWATFGLGQGTGITALHIGSQLRKEDRNR